MAARVKSGGRLAVLEQTTVPDWLEVLYRDHAGSLRSYAYQRVGQEADDVVADTFVAALQRRESFNPAMGTPRAWLFGIANREIGRHRRIETSRLRTAARVASERAAASGTDDRVDSVDAWASRAALAKAVMRLRGAEREVLLLFAWADLSYEEIAVALAIPVGTVRSRLSRARAKTKAALGGINPTSIIEEQRNE